MLWRNDRSAIVSDALLTAVLSLDESSTELMTLRRWSCYVHSAVFATLLDLLLHTCDTHQFLPRMRVRLYNKGREWNFPVEQVFRLARRNCVICACGVRCMMF